MRSSVGAVARAVRYGGVAAAALVLSACSMGNMFAPAPAGGSDARNASASANEMAVAATDALPAIATECPPIKVRIGGEALFYYGNGKIGDPRALQYQAVIDRQSRNCVVSNGRITVQMGIVGRVLLGPAGNQTSVDVPVRFAIERDNAALYSERYEVPVSIAAPAQSADFVKIVENVQIPYVGGEEITIWVGFDSRG